MPQGISLQRWAVGTAALLLFAHQGVQFLKRAQLVGPRAVPFRTVLLPPKITGGVLGSPAVRAPPCRAKGKHGEAEHEMIT